MKAAIFFLGLAACIVLLFVAGWILLFGRRRRGPVGPYERSALEQELIQACDALNELKPVSCTIAFADGLWTAVVVDAKGCESGYTSHHRGQYQNLWDYDPSWFDGHRGTPHKAAPSIEGWLNDRRDEYIHGIERPRAERRQIVNRPLDTLN